MRARRQRSRPLAAAILATLLVLAFLAVISDAPVPVPRPRRGPPTNVPVALVSLGDSTISGEGAGSYDPNTTGLAGNWCHRSADAEIDQTHIPGVTHMINLACSGAGTKQVGLGTETQYGEHSQADQLAVLARKYRIAAIVVAVGANDDPHFSAVLDDCVRAWVSNGSCSSGFDEQWRQRIAQMVPKVVGVLRDIRTTMTAAGYNDTDYQVVLQSYAAPIGPDVAAGLQSLAGCPFRSQDLQWVRSTGVTILDNGLREAASAAGVRFLDLSRAGIGHEACSGGNNPTTEWFTRLTVAWQDLHSDDRAKHALQESFHPNVRGAAAFGGCLAAFLATADRAATCLSGSDGVLRPASMVFPG